MGLYLLEDIEKAPVVLHSGGMEFHLSKEMTDTIKPMDGIHGHTSGNSMDFIPLDKEKLRQV